MAGFGPWHDKRNLDPYQDFSAEIEKALQDADYVLFCVTREAVMHTDN
jgi:hypothetical protein